MTNTYTSARGRQDKDAPKKGIARRVIKKHQPVNDADYNVDPHTLLSRPISRAEYEKLSLPKLEILCKRDEVRHQRRCIFTAKQIIDFLITLDQHGLVSDRDFHDDDSDSNSNNEVPTPTKPAHLRQQAQTASTVSHQPQNNDRKRKRQSKDDDESERRVKKVSRRYDETVPPRIGPPLARRHGAVAPVQGSEHVEKIDVQDVVTMEASPKLIHEMGVYDLVLAFRQKAMSDKYDGQFWQCLFNFLYELRPVDGELDIRNIRRVIHLRDKFLQRIVEDRCKALMGLSLKTHWDSEDNDDKLIAMGAQQLLRMIYQRIEAGSLAPESTDLPPPNKFSTERKDILVEHWRWQGQTTKEALDRQKLLQERLVAHQQEQAELEQQKKLEEETRLKEKKERKRSREEERKLEEKRRDTHAKKLRGELDQAEQLKRVKAIDRAEELKRAEEQKRVVEELKQVEKLERAEDLQIAEELKREEELERARKLKLQQESEPQAVVNVAAAATASASLSPSKRIKQQLEQAKLKAEKLRLCLDEERRVKEQSTKEASHRPDDASLNPSSKRKRGNDEPPAQNDGPSRKRQLRRTERKGVYSIR
ncbi:uncharacterized protein BDZ99DRAFT_481874 [Mytilinidion resinicola]|uniref:Uncharacterized protein n=1 Tax=Mytilinidion resinicola TaxID=574789 RepID=A0A6A6Y4Y0_9PEZI|nr:uncharacterized protein BDZ99DRAFT_481874 [Mytilinidion resinicola]KAF2803901.1 hypothetical protein BDZ99DRAFT_481874 [Mytilinidion resinicola]